MAAITSGRIFEKLQLIKYLKHYPELNNTMPQWEFSTDIIAKKHAKVTRYLDTIAAALYTGNIKDVIAVTLDKHRSLFLVLAKNGPLNEEDEIAAQRFFSAISKPTADASQVFPVLMSRCRLNIDRQISLLHQALCNIPFDLNTLLEAHQAVSLTEEFPGSTPYLTERYGDSEPPPFQTAFTHLLDDCAQRSDFSLDPEDVDAAFQKLSSLVDIARVLVRSRFLVLSWEDHEAQHMQWRSTLIRRLDKVCLYITGIENLIRGVKRWFPHGKIPHYWIPDSPPCEDSDIGIQLGLEGIKPCLSESTSLTAVLEMPLNPLDEKSPCISDQWGWEKKVVPYIHAEVRLIIHLCEPWLSLEQDGKHPNYDQGVRSIGTSKRSCCSCLVWINHFNHKFWVKWSTRVSPGRWDASWASAGAPPSCAEIMNLHDNGASSSDRAVRNDIFDYLKLGLYRIFLKPRSRWGLAVEDLPDDYYPY